MTRHILDAFEKQVEDAKTAFELKQLVVEAERRYKGKTLKVALSLIAIRAEELKREKKNGI